MALQFISSEGNRIVYNLKVLEGSRREVTRPEENFIKTGFSSPY